LNGLCAENSDRCKLDRDTGFEPPPVPTANTVERVTDTPFLSGPRPVVVAHRAGNTPQTVGDALDRADMIEFDTHVFRGRIEVRHPKVLWPTARLWEKWYLLPADTEVASIESVLDAVPPEVPLLVDLKCFTRRAGRRIRQAIPDDRRLIVSCRSWWVLGAFGNRPNTLALRSCGNRLQMRVVTLVPGLGQQTGIVAHNRLLDEESIGTILARTPLLFTWAVPTLARGRELVVQGLTGLIVDDLDLDWEDLRVVRGDS
jgi:hypothetical protein